MTEGRLIAVVGPSGVGKDSVILGIREALPHLHLVRRVITRAPDLSGEDYDAVSLEQFERMAQTGAFIAHWNAHGLRYGIPVSVKDELSKGHDCLVNFSRTALKDAGQTFECLIVLNITARPETISKRLADRGRETQAEIAARLARGATPLPDHLQVLHVSNDGPLSQTVARAVALLQPGRA